MARMFMCLQYKVYNTASIYIAAVHVRILSLSASGSHHVAGPLLFVLIVL